MPTVEAHLRKLKAVQDVVIKHLQEARDRHKAYADTKRREETFQIGDYVLLNARNLQIKGVASRKLSAKYVGPYEVIATHGNTAYKLPASMKIHPVFHVSLLKKY